MTSLTTKKKSEIVGSKNLSSLISSCKNKRAIRNVFKEKSEKKNHLEI
jgi:hypothetical protein